MTMTSSTAVRLLDPDVGDLHPAGARNGDSRVMWGIHTRQSIVDGETQGRLVGDYVIGHRLRPLDN